MRDLDARMAEISRRSAVRIKQRRKRRIASLTACVPLVVCVALFAGFGVQEKSDGAYAAGEMWKPGVAENEGMPDEMYSKQEQAADQPDSDPVNQKPEQLDYKVQYIRTDGYVDGAEFPCVAVIGSVEELNSYYKDNKDTFDLERKEKVYSDTTIGFLDACDRYDQGYFESKLLILVLLEEGSGSVRHEVQSVMRTDTGKVAVYVDRVIPEVGTDDMAQWHIILELDKEGEVPQGTDVQVWLNGSLATEDVD